MFTYESKCVTNTFLSGSGLIWLTWFFFFYKGHYNLLNCQIILHCVHPQHFFFHSPIPPMVLWPVSITLEKFTVSVFSHLSCREKPRFIILLSRGCEDDRVLTVVIKKENRRLIFYQWRPWSQMLGWKPATSEKQRQQFREAETALQRSRDSTSERQRQHPADLPPRRTSQKEKAEIPFSSTLSSTPFSRHPSFLFTPWQLFACASSCPGLTSFNLVYRKLLDIRCVLKLSHTTATCLQ